MWLIKLYGFQGYSSIYNICTLYCVPPPKAKSLASWQVPLLPVPGLAGASTNPPQGTWAGTGPETWGSLLVGVGPASLTPLGLTTAPDQSRQWSHLPLSRTCVCCLLDICQPSTRESFKSTHCTVQDASSGAARGWGELWPG